jgi:hypothetical protein
MFCTSCDLEVADLTHYKSILHGLNTKRKLMGYPPLTEEEFELDLKSEDLDTVKTEKKDSKKAEKVKFSKKCAFCDEAESAVHYREHGLSDEQIYCVNKKQCYVCYERFSILNDLIQHLELDQHRKTFSDGVSLILENGKVLNPSTTLMPVKIVIREEKVDKLTPKVDKIAEKVQEDRRVHNLKVSVEMNGRWGKWIH